MADDVKLILFCKYRYWLNGAGSMGIGHSFCGHPERVEVDISSPDCGADVPIHCTDFVMKGLCPYNYKLKDGRVDHEF